MDTLIRTILSQDPIWAAYAIASQRPDLAPFCRWTVAPDASGLVLVYTELEPPILFSIGSADGVAAALAAAELPERVYLNIQQTHLPLLMQHYPQIEQAEMMRMTLPAGIAHLPAAAQPTVPLTVADTGRLETLCAHGGALYPVVHLAGGGGDAVRARWRIYAGCLCHPAVG